MEYHVSLIGRNDLSGEIYRQLRRGILEGRLRPGASDFSDHLELIPSAAGLHVAAIARSASEARIGIVARWASELGVEVQELARFAVGGTGRPGLMVGYGGIPTADIQEGLQLLRGCFGR